MVFVNNIWCALPYVSYYTNLNNAVRYSILFNHTVGRLHVLVVTTCGDTQLAAGIPGVTYDERSKLLSEEGNMMPILSSNSEIDICDFHRSESHAFELQKSNFSYSRCPMVDSRSVDSLNATLFDWIEDKVMWCDVELCS